MAVTVTVPLPVPDVGDSESHDALSLADQARVPPPVLPMLTIWVAGLPPPCWAVKDRLLGLAPIAGGAAAGGAVVVVVVGVRSCDRPGMASVSLCMPLPRLELLPEVDEPAVAIPENIEAVGVEDV